KSAIHLARVQGGKEAGFERLPILKPPALPGDTYFKLSTNRKIPNSASSDQGLVTDYESGGRRFESFRARHFGTKLGTQKPAAFTLEAATSVRGSTLFDPMMRTSFASASTRWASARRWLRHWQARQLKKPCCTNSALAAMTAINTSS